MADFKLWGVLFILAGGVGLYWGANTKIDVMKGLRFRLIAGGAGIILLGIILLLA